MEVIDTRGLSCPQPVLLALEYIKNNDPDSLAVLVDNDASQENVTRAAENRGYTVETLDEGGGAVRLALRKQ